MTQVMRVVLMGAGGVGKSAIAVQYMQGVFLRRYDPTLEETFIKSVTVDNKKYNLEILDTAGTESFSAMKDVYIRNGGGFILVFSLIAKSTLFDLEQYCEHIKRIKGQLFPCVVAGNKCDLENKRVFTEEGLEFATTKSNGIYYETSAKTNTNIDEVFRDIINQLLENNILETKCCIIL